jgi:hypothetical protein
MKMRTSAKKILIPMMALTVCLAGIGVGYGLWDDSIDIQVGMTEAVGNLCFGFSYTDTDDWPVPELNHYDHTCTSPIPPMGVGPMCIDSYGYGEPRKDVGSTRSFLDDPVEDCENCYNRVLVTVNGAYPSYASMTSVIMKNCGITGIVIDDEFFELPEEMRDQGFYFKGYRDTVSNKCGFIMETNGVADFINVTSTPDWEPPPDERWVNTIPNPDRPPDDPNDDAVLDACWINFEGELLDADETADADLLVHVLQPADYDMDYSFYVHVVVGAY